MDTQLFYDIKYGAKNYQISAQIIKQIGVLSGLLDAGITDLELPLSDFGNKDEFTQYFIHEFLEYLTTIKEPNQKPDIFRCVLYTTGDYKLENYINNIQAGKYNDDIIRFVNKRIFILLHVADYWDFKPITKQIREYISQFIKICDLDTINRWLGGII